MYTTQWDKGLKLPFFEEFTFFIRAIAFRAEQMLVIYSLDSGAAMLALNLHLISFIVIRRLVD